MKKQKPPIILGSTLVVIAGLVAVVSVLAKPKTQEDLQREAMERAQAEAKASEGQARKAPSKAAMKGALAKAAPSAGMEPEEESSGISPTPTILLPEQQRIRNTPNDSSISTQWFTEESRSANRKDVPAPR